MRASVDASDGVVPSTGAEAGLDSLVSVETGAGATVLMGDGTDGVSVAAVVPEELAIGVVATGGAGIPYGAVKRDESAVRVTCIKKTYRVVGLFFFHEIRRERDHVRSLDTCESSRRWWVK